MRTRALSRDETGQAGAVLHRIESESAEEQTTDQDRSSVTDPSADFMSAKLNNSFLNLEEPVLLVTDRRIRNLMAQSTTEKLVLENTLKDLNKQAERHREIQEGVRTPNF